uniref:RNA polymerase alpha subunit n=1 Tax=Chorda asiatica TaxID=1281577 RepID=UPI002E76CEB8|nr:RNA polymerase alpha subunit [Chorda asiatica]WAM62155.1 RNA polymerase alpha subunit [Chorda asiatica]
MKIYSKCKCVDLDLFNSNEFYGHFVFTSLEQSEGNTIGNMLRRTLLSNLYGFRITGVRVPGINNEFSSLEGVREDLLEIILNLKQIIISDPNNVGESCYGLLKTQGPAIITAGALTLPHGMKVLNPNNHLLTISDDSLVELEIKIEYGKSYILAKDQKLEGSPDFIPIDSNFAPVVKVNSYVKPLLQDIENTDEELHLEIFTNGTLLPHQALIQARNIIGYMLSPIMAMEFSCFDYKEKDIKNSNTLINKNAEDGKLTEKLPKEKTLVEKGKLIKKKTLVEKRKPTKEKIIIRKGKSTKEKALLEKEKPSKEKALIEEGKLIKEKALLGKEKPPKEKTLIEKEKLIKEKSLLRKEKPPNEKTLVGKTKPIKEKSLVRKEKSPKEKALVQKEEHITPEERLLERITDMESGSLKGLGLSNRIIKFLNKAGINFTWDLMQYPSPNLITIEGLGPKSVEEITDKLALFFEPPY